MPGLPGVITVFFHFDSVPERVLRCKDYLGEKIGRKEAWRRGMREGQSEKLKVTFTCDRPEPETRSGFHSAWVAGSGPPCRGQGALDKGEGGG